MTALHNPEKVAAVLERAAQLLEPDNWQQNAYGVGAGPFCAVGALRQAAGIGSCEQNYGTPGFNERSGRCDAAMRALEEQLPRQEPIAANVVRWNDQDGQTLGNVVATMRRAAAAVLP